MVNRQAPDTSAAFWRQLTTLVVVNVWLCIWNNSHVVRHAVPLSFAYLLNGWSKWQHQANSITNVISCVFQIADFLAYFKHLTKKCIQLDDYEPDYTFKWIRIRRWRHQRENIPPTVYDERPTIVDSTKWIVKQYEELSTPEKKNRGAAERKLFSVDYLWQKVKRYMEHQSVVQAIFSVQIAKVV